MIRGVTLALVCANEREKREEDEEDEEDEEEEKEEERRREKKREEKNRTEERRELCCTEELGEDLPKIDILQVKSNSGDFGIDYADHKCKLPSSGSLSGVGVTPHLTFFICSVDF